MMKNKLVLIIGGVVIIILAVGLLWYKISHKTETLQSTNNQGSTQNTIVDKTLDSDKDGIPDTAEKTLGTDPYNTDTNGNGIPDNTDKSPVLAENPIQNISTAEGFQIKEAIVENNVDPATNKIANDHFEVTLKNVSGKNLTNFDLYYAISDPKTNQKEGYYKKMTGFVLAAGSTKTIHFDQTKEQLGQMSDGHFGENINSIYRTTNNAKNFDLTLSTPGYKTVEMKINKDPGGAEKAD